ncbi:hypothetical protein ACTXT7_011591 [Hymenolepis weldensis]
MFCSTCMFSSSLNLFLKNVATVNYLSSSPTHRNVSNQLDKVQLNVPQLDNERNITTAFDAESKSQ